MSKVIDISSQLTNERPRIKITEDLIVEVDNSKNNVLTIMSELDEEGQNDVEMVDSLMVKLFGEKDSKKLDELNLTLPSYLTIIKAALAQVLDVEMDVIDNMFRTEFEK